MFYIIAIVLLILWVCFWFDLIAHVNSYIQRILFVLIGEV